MSKKQKPFKVQAGAIVTREEGGILYESFVLSEMGLSKDGIKRLAQLNNENPEITWDECDEILVREGYLAPME